ncbi:FAD-binding oxidoreductase [Paracoccus aerodenitrificans]|uniref:FAD-binding oxidoreductase n=1 Tax=Paracoccus aerodenitrificans TaxID=3017781 RepID=UPI0022F0C22E|nr:FAD-binding oxidoreductase [Paracoccus aerodenitrificans]WBU63559.1 FAD-binding oxidoreductase [Paracoccus aerodenitrificans]
MSEILQSFRSEFPEGVILPPAEAGSYTSDIYGEAEAPCLMVARPTSTDEVSRLLRMCHDRALPVVPQGGNTNVCRMAVPTGTLPAVVLSLGRMTRIESLDPQAATVTVQAGCLIQTLQEAALDRDLLFAPDWGARGSATVGGAVGTNGGGLNVLRYGTTREQVLGLEVVLPDGRVWNGLRALTKDNSGYDLKQLFIGSEGSLGIVTRIVFRLHPAPRVNRSMMVALSDLNRLPDLMILARRKAGRLLSAVELLPGLGVSMALERYPDLRRPFETIPPWSVLIRLSDTAEVEPMLLDLFEVGLEDDIFSDGVLAQSVAQDRNLWEIREQMMPHQYFPGMTMLKWDVSVPVGRIAEFIARADALVAETCPGATPYAVSHVGDGNVHYSAFADPATPGFETMKQETLRTIDELIWSFGGSVIAEHGVGSVFVDRMRDQKSDVEYAIQQGIKRLIDPGGLMNPGKLISD